MRIRVRFSGLRRHQNITLRESILKSEVWSFLKVFSEMVDSNPKSSKKQDEEFSERQDGANATAAVEYGNIVGTAGQYLNKQCAKRFPDYNAYVSHSKNGGHAFMVKITGFADTDQDKMPRGFPELYYCALCDIFNFTSKYHKIHLMSQMHTETANYVKNIFFWKQKIIVGLRSKNNEPKSFQDFENLKLSPYNYCELCDTYCNNAKNFQNHIEGSTHKSLLKEVMSCNICNLSYVCFDYYMGHINSPLHAKLKSLMHRMSIPEYEITKTPEKRRHVSQTNEVNDHYFCKLCNIKFDNVVSFRKHRSFPIHRNMQQLVQMMSNVRDRLGQDGATYEESFPYMHYCDLCNVFFSNFLP